MKTKTSILTLVLGLTFWFNHAQTRFDRFEDMDGVSSVIVNQKAFELMSQIGEESDKEYLDLIKNITSLKVFATEDPKIADQLKAEADSYLKTANLEELMRVKDKGDHVKIYVREGNSSNFVKELFMIASEEDKKETVVISLTGNIDLRQISKLTDKMDLPGGDELKKVNKK
jgi:hypothetical protein